MTIKAIETRYNGYRFRSRTEARWAVFFDAAGIRYEYEKEGYELPSGRYLPDFWLPDVEGGAWFEVKGVAPSAGEIRAMHELVDVTEVTFAVITHGGPEVTRLSVISSLYQSDDDGRVYPFRREGWRRLAANTPIPGKRVTLSGKFGHVVDGLGGECGVAVVPPVESPEEFREDFWSALMKSPVYGADAYKECGLIERARSAAKSARFEYGESGALAA